MKKSTKEAREEGKRILENSEQKLCQLLKFSDSRKISSSSSKAIGKFPIRKVFNRSVADHSRKVKRLRDVSPMSPIENSKEDG